MQDRSMKPSRRLPSDGRPHERHMLCRAALGGRQIMVTLRLCDNI
jgi:hypothetical protein